MKNFLKLSALATVLVASATYSSAATINLSSTAGSSASNTNGALQFLGYVSAGFTIPNGGGSTVIPASPGFSGTGSPTTPTSATFNIGTGNPVGTWSGPLGSSTWVSFNPNTAPGGSLVANNGYYEYLTTFTTTSVGGAWSGSINVLADDTVDVFLNGVEIFQATADTNDGHCSNGVPSCTSAIGTNVALTGINQNGLNNLVFVVEQTGAAATGLDFSGSISQPVSTTPVPEPSTLLMLGTGLMGSAGALFRRMRK